VENPADSSTADRERVADFVRRALPRELQHREITWPHVLAHDKRSIRLTLTRGALLIPAAITMGGPPAESWTDMGEEGPWWTPATKTWATELTRRLVHVAWLRHLPFREADEGGHLHATLWRDGNRWAAKETGGMERVGVVLEPGYQLERAPGGELELRRFLDPKPVRLGKALQEGLVRVDEG
jgi:hypothetical protein